MLLCPPLEWLDLELRAQFWEEQISTEVVAELSSVAGLQWELHMALGELLVAQLHDSQEPAYSIV